jgi:uncharacterized protein YegL
MADTTDLDLAEFAENPEPRCPCVLLLDTSGSMQGDPIKALNQGLQAFKDDLSRDPLASRRVELAVVTFDSHVKVVQDFVTADQFQPPRLSAQGATHMGSGIHKALEIIQARKDQYNANGITYYRPWVFMITDGEPQAGLTHHNSDTGSYGKFRIPSKPLWIGVREAGPPIRVQEARRRYPRALNMGNGLQRDG